MSGVSTISLLMEYKEDYVNVTVKPITKARLNDYGHKGETYDQIISRLLDLAKQHTEDAQ